MNMQEKINQIADENWNVFYGQLTPAELGWTEKQLIILGMRKALELPEVKALVEALKRLQKLANDEIQNPMDDDLDPAICAYGVEEIISKALNNWNSFVGGSNV